MNLDTAIQHIKTKNPSMSNTVENNLTDALKKIDEEKDFLESFTEENLNKLYEIEMISTTYFQGLSITAAKTMVALHKANSKLSATVLLNTTDSLASRSRPWESLHAFSKIAESCPTQINEEMLTYLLKIKSDFLEVTSHDIKEATDKFKKEKAGAIGAISPKAICEIQIKQTVEKLTKHNKQSNII